METLKRKLVKDFGEYKITMASDIPILETVSTGSTGLDFATGVGGIPRGTYAEIFGPESVGKTTLTYYMIAEEQRKGNTCAFINLEGQFDPRWAHAVAGVNPDELILGRPENGEEAADMLLAIINHEEKDGEHVSLIIFDSIGVMMSAKEVEEDGKDRVGGQSKLVTGMVKRVIPAIARHGVTVVFLNQVRDVMRASYSNVYQSPGGHALKHGASMVIQLKVGTTYQGEYNGQRKEIGNRVIATVKKNKAAAPKAVAEWDFIHSVIPGKTLGIDRRREIIDLALQYGVIEQHGSAYHHPLFPVHEKSKETKIITAEKVIEFVTGDQKILDKLREDLMTLAQQGGKSE